MKNKTLLWTLVFILLCSFASAEIVGNWTFSGDATDSSPYGNDGVVTGAVLCKDMWGNSNSAYCYNGTSDYIEVTDSDELDGMNQLGMFFTVNATSSDFMDMIRKSNSYFVRLQGGALYFWIYNSTEQFQAQAIGNAYTYGQFSRFYVEYDGTNLTTWKDGKMLKTEINTIGSDSIGVNANNLNLGRIGAFWMNGTLDDIIIQNHTATKSELLDWFGITNFTIQARDWLELTQINTFNTTINGSLNLNTTTGTITTGLLSNDPNTYNITIQASGYTTRTITAQSPATNLNADITNSSSRLLTINVLNWLGNTLLTTINIWNNHTLNTDTTNPYQENLLSYINIENQTINPLFNITDPDYYHQDYSQAIIINATRQTINITLTGANLRLNFTQKGSAINTYGYIADMTPRRMDFYNVTVAVVKQNLSDGRVNVRFGMNNQSTNWTQYYEFNNDNINSTFENLELLENNDWSAYIRVLDYNNNPIEGATIRAYQMQNTTMNTWTSATVFGQRLTEHDGYTFFVADRYTEVMFTITNDGYGAEERLVTIGDEGFTRDNPLTIYLQEQKNAVLNNAWFYCTNSIINNETTTINCILTAVGRDLVQIQTPYREQTLGLTTRQTLTCDGLDRCAMPLTEGTHWSGTQNLTVSIWLDNTFWANKTLTFDTTTTTEIFDDDTYTALNTTQTAPLIHIIIIIISLGAGLLFGATGIGKTTYLVGLIIMPLIHTQFLWLTMIPALYIITRITKRLISE